jgi:hypothetical protein
MWQLQFTKHLLYWTLRVSTKLRWKNVWTEWLQWILRKLFYRSLSDVNWNLRNITLPVVLEGFVEMMVAVEVVDLVLEQMSVHLVDNASAVQIV